MAAVSATRSLQSRASSNDPESQWFVWISKACPHISLASTNSIACKVPPIMIQNCSTSVSRQFAGELVQWKRTAAKGKTRKKKKKNQDNKNKEMMRNRNL
jgi:hypothetical protein